MELYNNHNYKFECRLQRSLDLQNPTTASNRNRVGILASEITFRPILLVCRTGRVVKQILVFVLSIPLHLVSIRHLPIVYQPLFFQFRHLTADLFEYVGVVVFSILLLPFDRNSSPRLLNAQVWIETAAEVISGEYAVAQGIRTLQKKSLEKRNLWVQLRNMLPEPTFDSAEFTDRLGDLNREISRLAFIQQRRISRHYERIENDRFGEYSFSDIEELVGADMDKAIEMQEGHLSILDPTYAFDDIHDKSRIEYFGTVSREIQTKIDEFHALHDPNKQVKNALETLQQKVSTVLNDGSKDVAWKQILLQHYLPVVQKLKIIEHLYSYKGGVKPSHMGDYFNQILMIVIQDCSSCFQERQAAWERDKLDPLNRDEILNTLQIEEGEDEESIDEAYQRYTKMNQSFEVANPIKFRNFVESYHQLLLAVF